MVCLARHFWSFFSRLQDEDGDGKSAKSELPTVTEAVSEVTPGQEKPLSGVRSSSHKGGAEKPAGRKGVSGEFLVLISVWLFDSNIG